MLCVYMAENLKKGLLNRKEYNKGVDLWSDDAYRFACSCCDDAECCKDAVQEAFAKLWEHREEVRWEKGKAFLLSVVHNHLVSRLRYDKVRSIRGNTIEEALSPDVSFDLKEAINRAMSALPQVQRECVQLRDVEGYSYKEIANILNISDQQVQVYIFRARVALKRQLKEYHI